MPLKPFEQDDLRCAAMLTDALSNLLERASGGNYGTRTALLADDVVAETVKVLGAKIAAILATETAEAPEVAPVTPN